MQITRDELTKFKTQFPDAIPVIITKGKDVRFIWTGQYTTNTVKLGIPEHRTMSQLMIEIHKIIKQMNTKPTTDAIYLSCGGNMINCGSVTVGQVFSRYNKGGVLYMELNGESAFG